MKKIKGFTLGVTCSNSNTSNNTSYCSTKNTDKIKNSKIASFESSAKTIAAQAEKKKMEKEILEDTSSISCSDIVKLNDSDYGPCTITFDGNKAKVTITGKI